MAGSGSHLDFRDRDAQLRGLEAHCFDLLVIGGGIIGLAMATVYATLGAAIASVSIASALKDVYRRMDERVSGVVLPVTPTPWEALNRMLGGGLGNGKLYITGNESEKDPYAHLRL